MRKNVQRAIFTVLHCLILIFSGAALRAQVIMATPVPIEGSIRGKVTDKNSNGIFGVSVQVKYKDSIMLSYTFTDEKGAYLLSRLPVNTQFKIVLSAQGYRDTVFVKKLEFRDFNLSNQDYTLSAIPYELKEVEIKGRKPPFVIKKDTLEFDATAFKMLPHAILEDLLKRLPGVIIDKDGIITVNGKKANKIQVDGRDFFGGNMSIARQNLQASIIDKIEVTPDNNGVEKFGKLTAVPGQSVNINVKLKKESNTGILGNLEAGYGTSERYTASGLLATLGGKNRYGISGNAGNGFQGTSAFRMGGTLQASQSASGSLPASTSAGSTQGGGGSYKPSPGISDRKGLSANMNTDFGKGTSLDFNYSLSHNKTLQVKRIDRLNFLPQGTNTYKEDQSGESKLDGHTLSASFSYEPNSSRSFRLSPTFTYSNSGSDLLSEEFTSGSNGKVLNLSSLNNHIQGRGKGLNNTIGWGQRLKDGKTSYHLSWTMNIDDRLENLLNSSSTQFFSGTPGDMLVAIDQRGTSAERTFANSFSARISRSLGGYFSAGLEYRSNFFSGAKEREIFQSSRNTGTLTLDTAQSGKTTVKNSQNLGLLEIAFKVKKLELAVNAGIQFISQRNGILERDTIVRNSMVQFLPRFTANYSLLENTRLGIAYDISTEQPSPSQVSPIEDVSNPLVVIKGNPFLKSSTAHNVSFSLNRFVPQQELVMYLSGGLGFIKNAIVQESSYDGQGRQLQSFRNVDGSNSFALRGSLQSGYHLNNLGVKPEVSFSMNRNNDVAVIGGQQEESRRSTYGVNLGSAIILGQFITLYSSAAINFNKTDYGRLSSKNLSFNTQEYALDLKAVPKKKMEVGTTFSVMYNSQIPRDFGRSARILNCSVGYRFLKNESLNIKFFAYDLFNQAIVNTTSVTTAYKENVSYNSLKRYFMLSLVYNLNGLSMSPVPVLK